MKKIVMILAMMMFGISAFAYSGTSDWAEEELKNAEKYGLIPNVLYSADVSKPINRAEFAAASVKLYEALSGEKVGETTENPFSDTEDSEILKAYSLGITSGVTVNSFEPDSLLSREQAATMLARVYTVYTGDSITNNFEKRFADDADISRWAKESVYFMAEHGIITGMENNIFAPRNITAEHEMTFYANCTREQALAISKRMYEKFQSDKPAVTEPPTETSNPQKPNRPSEGDKTDYLALIPDCEFGKLTDEKSDAYGASVTYKGVTQEDYEAYVKTVEGRYPTHVNNLNEATQFVIKSDGTYNIKVSFVGDEMTISVEDAQ